MLVALHFRYLTGRVHDIQFHLSHCGCHCHVLAFISTVDTRKSVFNGEFSDTARCQSREHSEQFWILFSQALAEKYLDELEKGHDVVMEEHRIVTVWKDAVKLNVQGASKSTAKCMAVFEQLQSRKISEPEARVKISECKAATSEMAGVLAKLLKNLSPSLERLKSALQRFNQVNDNIGLYCAKLRREARYKKWWRNVLGECLQSWILLLAAIDGRP